MVLRRIIIDNSLRYIPKSKQTRENKDNTIKNKSTPRNKTKIFHKTKKGFLKNFSAQGFKYLK